MDNNISGVFGLAYLLVRLLIYLNRDRPSISYPTKRKENDDGDRVVYLSNGKKLNTSITYYYLQLLDIDYATNISDKTIEDAARSMRKRILYNENDSIIVSLQDVQAARLYLLDQWRYFIRKN